MVGTFFGHRDTPTDIEHALRRAIQDLIENKKVDVFYVGNQGNFDALVRRVLKDIQIQYPHVQYTVVLAYMPTEKDIYEDFSDTIYPDGLETVPKKFAIVARNQWMLNKADYVVSYVTCSTGGAARFTALAEKKGKTIIRLRT